MKLNRVASVLVAFLLLAPSLLAAQDLSGRWTGSFNISINGGETRDDSAVMVFKQTGTDLTGTAGPNETEQWAIAKGKVVVTKADGKESTKVTFEVVTDGGGGPVLFVELALVEDRLKGNAKAEQGGMTMTAVIDLARAK
jgi:hypothetical protein